MSNFNGLIECKSVCGTGETASAFYARSTAPVLVAPVVIRNPETGESCSILCNEVGQCRIDSLVGSMEVSGPIGVSTVYDRVYNPIASYINGWVSAESYPGPEFTDVSPEFTLTNGRYMVQMSVRLTNAGSFSIPVDGVIQGYLQAWPVAPGDPDLRFSSCVATTPMMASPSAGTTNDMTYCSGVFDITNDEITYAFGIEISGAWNFGTGANVVLQLVRMAGVDPNGPS